MKKLNKHARIQCEKGLTFIETMIAMSISAFAITALVAVIIMVNSSMREGIWENNLRSEGSLFMEKVKQSITFSFRNDALESTLRPVIATSKDSIAFFTPDDDNDGVEESYFIGFNDSIATQLIIRRNGTTIETLDNVTDFNVDSQEALVTFMITLSRNVNMGSRSAAKQFTLVGRALPRNMGEIKLIGDGTLS